MKKKFLELLKFLVSPLLNEFGVVGVIQDAGLDTLVNGIQGLADMVLAASPSGSYGAAVGEADVAFTASTGGAGLIEITGDVTITIPSDNTILWLYCYSPTAGTIATVEIDTDNVFTNGGDLIVTSFEITVT